MGTLLHSQRPKGGSAPTSATPGTQRTLASAVDACQDLHRAICKKTGTTKDPTGIVKSDHEGELEALRIYEEIIREHKDWSLDQIDEALVKRIYTPKRTQKIASAFLWVQDAMKRLIDREPESVFSAEEKKRLKARIRKLALELPPPASLYADEPDLYTKNDVFYERTADGRMRLRVGGAYLFTAKSWFNIVFTLAHEVAHSIDPCEMRFDARLSLPAYDRLGACFMKNQLIRMTPERHECADNDQLSEAFADWFAVRVTAEALEKYATEFDSQQMLHSAGNSVRDLCEQDQTLDVMDLSNHPSPQVRIEGIFGRNAKIRSLLGCETAPLPASDCGFDFEDHR